MATGAIAFTAPPGAAGEEEAGSASDRSSRPGFTERLDGRLTALALAPPSERVAVARQALIRLTAGRVTVEVSVDPVRTRETVERLSPLLTELNWARGLVGGQVEPADLDQLAQAPGVHYVRSWAPPEPSEVTSVGVKTSEANTAHKAGITGAGQTVMVIDIGFSGYEAARNAGELPSDVVLLGISPCLNDTHGTNAAEVVHDMAPAAKMVLVCQTQPATLPKAVQYATTNGVDVISRSLGNDRTKLRGDGSGGPGTPDADVRAAHNGGVLWVNAAANDAIAHWKGSFSDPDNDKLLNYTPSDEKNDFRVHAGQNVCAVLKWDDWPTTTVDLDLRLRRSSDNVQVGQSVATQNGSQPPVERACFTNNGAQQEFYPEVRHFSGGPVPRVDLFLEPQQLVFQHPVPAGSIDDVAANPLAVSVGATLPFLGEALFYSARGPTIDGRIAPDIAGPTNGATTQEPLGFSGTSGAAPHVAGAALLYKQARGLDPAALQAFLRRTARDVGAAGPDNDTGYGKLRVAIACAGREATRIGTGASERLRGTKRADVILGLEGRDTLIGRRGRDRLCGGRGKDKLLGGPGRDLLFGEFGRDLLRGGPGRDREHQ